VGFGRDLDEVAVFSWIWSDGGAGLNDPADRGRAPVERAVIGVIGHVSVASSAQTHQPAQPSGGVACGVAAGSR